MLAVGSLTNCLLSCCLCAQILEIGEIVFEHSAAALTDFVVSYNTNSIGPISVTVFVTHDRTVSSSSSSVVQQAGATATTVEQQ